MNDRRFELDITLSCTLKCDNCDRACFAQTRSELTVEQIKKFIDDSNLLQYSYNFVSVLGGEPTLHPNLLEILDLLYFNLKFNNTRAVKLKTNGYSSKTKEVIKTIPSYITIENSAKINSHPLFSRYTDAPIDYLEYQTADFSVGCPIFAGCGPSLYPPGKYFCCGAGASIDRIFNLGLGVNTLIELDSKLIEQKNAFCRLCGHFKDWGQPHKYDNKQINSKSWEAALTKYKLEN